MKYIAYGSNLHPHRLQRRTPSAQLVGTAKLSQWSLKFHQRCDGDQSAKCNIIPSAHDCVHVAIYELALSEVPSLDRFEGLGHDYDRCEFTLADYGECFIYLATPARIDGTWKPYTWYRDLVLLGCEFHGFPADYVKSIQSVPALDDPDPARNRQQMELVTHIRTLGNGL